MKRALVIFAILAASAMIAIGLTGWPIKAPPGAPQSPEPIYSIDYHDGLDLYRGREGEIVFVANHTANEIVCEWATSDRWDWVRIPPESSAMIKNLQLADVYCSPRDYARNYDRGTP